MEQQAHTHTYIYIYIFFFWSHCEACGILAPQSGIEPTYLPPTHIHPRLKCTVLTTGLTGKFKHSYFKLQSIAISVFGRNRTNLLTLLWENQQRLSKTTIFGKLPYNKIETGKHVLIQSTPNCELFYLLQMRKRKHRGVLSVSRRSRSQEKPVRPSGAHECNHLSEWVENSTMPNMGVCIKTIFKMCTQFCKRHFHSLSSKWRIPCFNGYKDNWH